VTDFNGILTVPVSVNDGEAGSNTFSLSVTVTPVNDPPVITTALSTPEETPLTPDASPLTISDPDSSAFTLAVQDGTGYTRSGNTITPETDFNGTLTVPRSPAWMRRTLRDTGPA